MPTPVRSVLARSTLVAALAALASPDAALAQPAPPGTDAALDVQNLWPSAGPTDSLTLRTSAVSPAGAIGFALVANAMYRPLTLNVAGQSHDAVEYAVTTDFAWSVGVHDRVQLMFAVPVVVAQSGDGAVPVAGASAAPLADTALRDLRFDVAVAIVQRARRSDATGFGLRLDLGGAIPFGDDAGFQGAGGWTFAPTLAADYRTSYNLHFTVNVGARLRETHYFADRVWGSQLLVAGGVSYRPGASSRLTLSAELADLFSLVTAEPYQTITTSEFYLGARYAFDQARDIELFAGAGLPFPTDERPTTPAWRGILGLNYAPRGHDDDRDGVQDTGDRCPGRPEDRDGHEDGDGCPDPDNDADGVLDTSDRCPGEPEDADNHEDGDGCPDPDNDGDGVSDADDQCADEPAGAHPDSDRRGCPVRDTDTDGVLDDVDQCMETAAGAHPDATRPGCPQPDRDGDGVPDGADACPAQPAGERADRYRAGCPDVDLDRDGVAGDDDRCPDQPETINGAQDDDGCPDAGAEVVTWDPTGDALRFARPLVVAAGAQRLAPAAEALLAQVAHRIRARGGEVARVVVTVDGARTPAAQAEAARLAEVVADVLLARRIPRRQIASGATPAPTTPAPPGARAVPGTVRVRIERAPEATPSP